jgi:hypothetical protein
MRGLGALAGLAVLLMPGIALANGEPSSWLGEAGDLVPITETNIHVQAERLIIALPAAAEEGWHSATVRAEYTLLAESSGSEPVRAQIAFPVSSFAVPSEHGESQKPEPTAYVKLDGRPIAVRFLTFSDLADPWVKEWQADIERRLREMPELRQQIAAVRAESNERGGLGWLCSEGVGNLAMWLQSHGGPPAGERPAGELIAGGLLGVRPYTGGGRVDCVQSALQWLNPKHERVDVHQLLSQRWDHEPLLLDPYTGQLHDPTDTGSPAFGTFVFAIELERGVQHQLVVQYRQGMGYLNARGGNHSEGLRYIMKTARRWGRWGATDVEIRVPPGWEQVATRPPATHVATEDSMRVYSIEMKHRPVEDLYVSGVPVVKTRGSLGKAPAASHR